MMRLNKSSVAPHLLSLTFQVKTVKEGSRVLRKKRDNVINTEPVGSGRFPKWKEYFPDFHSELTY
ncbi:hypothetical protein CGI42_13195, partial [Vibrio parahaemolyticus]|uniref:hypothetical protein n=1 Tax=Vibrio parahaemolyticus TaxID=670 RepID=UPI00116897FC